MSHIFVSYSRKDSDCVYAVVDALKKADFPIWIDLESIPISSEWLTNIEKAINDAKVFMLFWSASAKESDYVTHELQIAQQLSIENKIKVCVVMLDDTKPLPLEHIQAQNLKSGCSPTAISGLLNALPVEWKAFSYTKSLAEQSHTLVQDDFVSVRYSDNATCKAYIVGKANATLPKKPQHLAIALQFFRPTTADMLDSVISSLPTPDTWILHVTGPVQGEDYRLDNNQPQQWEDSRKFIVKMIQAVGDQSNTTLHFYTLTPNALLGGVTMPLYRFWHVTLYNFVNSVYLPVVNIPRS